MCYVVISFRNHKNMCKCYSFLNNFKIIIILYCVQNVFVPTMLVHSTRPWDMIVGSIPCLDIWNSNNISWQIEYHAYQNNKTKRKRVHWMKTSHTQLYGTALMTYTQMKKIHFVQFIAFQLIWYLEFNLYVWVCVCVSLHIARMCAYECT